VSWDRDTRSLSDITFAQWSSELAHCVTPGEAQLALAGIAGELRGSLRIEDACGALGIEIKGAALAGQVGLAYRHHGRCLILLDPVTPQRDRPFVIAHELGHHLLRLALRHGLPLKHEEPLCDYFASVVTGFSRAPLSA